MFSSIKMPSRRTVRLLLFAFIVAIGLCIPAVCTPSFAAKAPGQVKNVQIDPDSVTDFSFVVSWNMVNDAKHYVVNVKKASAKKWSKIAVLKDTYYKVDVDRADTKYKVRIRAVTDGKAGKWSAVKSVRTKLVTPNAIWAKYISNSVIEVEWQQSYKAEKYKVSWYNDTPEDTQSKVVKAKKGSDNNSLRVEGLMESSHYAFMVQAMNDKKRSNPVMVDLSTYDEDCVLQNIDPYSAKYSLTRFIQNGSEYDIPAMYATYYDDEGYLESDGFFFPDLYLDKVIVRDAVIQQYQQTDVPITTETTYRVGDQIQTLDGQTVEIKELRLTTNPNETFDNCIDYREAYTKIDEFEIWIETNYPGTDNAGPTMFICWEPEWQ